MKRDIGIREKPLCEVNQPSGCRTKLVIIVALFVSPLALPSTAGTPRPDEEVHKGTEEGLTRPKPLKRVRAVYDEAARKEKIRGVVKLKMIISSEVKPQNITVFESLDPRLDAKAIAAAKQWEWQPARLNGKPVACEVVLEFGFEP